ncbi:MAG: MBL fold metallo-hydrolase [Chitinophagaceae bacterium]|nr:MBL fold metallo-hydrolase [Chitinophagaceae bacterium]
MPLYIASLNSGSNGNCYYVGNHREAVLVDAGISCRETEKRMNRLGLDMNRVKAIFVSHEHGDHITGIPALSKKFRLPVYITRSTLHAAGIPVDNELVYEFIPDVPVSIGSLNVVPFVKHHDASDPYSFVITEDAVRVGVLTDIGNVCKKVAGYFSQCNAVFLESNYCEDMLMNGSYPWHLKKRISGGRGHLSNREALDLFTRHRGTGLSHLILSHLSKNNNTPELVESIFKEIAGETEIVVASRYRETAVYCIDGSKQLVIPAVQQSVPALPQQLTLF